MISPLDRIARMRRLIAEKAAGRGDAGAPGAPDLTTDLVLEAARAKVTETLGPDAPLPASLTAIDRRQARERVRDEVVRLSRLGLSLTEIVDRTGLKYGNVAKIRHDRGVSRPRSRG